MEQQSTRSHWRAADMIALAEANVIERMGFYSRRGQVAYQHNPEQSWIATGINYPNAFLNMVFRRMFGAGHVDTQIEHTLRRIRHGDAPLFWMLHPSLRARELGVRLENHGLHPVGEAWFMAMALEQAPDPDPAPAELTIARVANHEELVQWVQLLAQGHPGHDQAILQWIDLEAKLGLSAWSPWQRYIGYWEGEPVATSALFCATESAGIYHVATMPNARGRGIGAALTQAALQEGRLRGYEVAVLEATEMGLPLYQRLGFQCYQPISVYMTHRQN
jgi:GNAT superfamily N-acetyltransferase